MNVLRVALGEGSWTQTQVTLYEAKRLEKVGAESFISSNPTETHVKEGLSTGAVQEIIKKKLEAEFLTWPIMLGLPLIKLGYQPPPPPTLKDTSPKLSEIPVTRIASKWGF